MYSGGHEISGSRNLNQCHFIDRKAVKHHLLLGIISFNSPFPRDVTYQKTYD